MSPPNDRIEAQLAAIEERCGIAPYFLRADDRNVVTIHVPPTVRAVPLKYRHMECLRVELGKIPGLRMADPPRSPQPATIADLQMHLAQIHYHCELGPYELKARSATRAFITIPPTIRVDPLAGRQMRCVTELVERIDGVRLEPGVVPTVD